MRAILDSLTHVVKHMAEFMGQGLQESTFVGDDALCKLHLAFVSDLRVMLTTKSL